MSGVAASVYVCAGGRPVSRVVVVAALELACVVEVAYGESVW